MFKLAGAVIDCYDDPKFMANYQAMALLGSDIIDPSKLDKLADNQFAVKIRDGNVTARKFPIYNELMTKISCAYLCENMDKLPEDIVKVAATRIAAACQRYDLNVPKELAEIDKTAQYVVVIDNTDNTPPSVNQSEELSKIACFEAAKQFDKMTPEDRVILAFELDKVGAAAHRQDVYDYVPTSKFGPLLKQAIKDRQYILQGDHTNESEISLGMLNQLYWSHDQKDPLTFSVELANFDKAAGLRNRYKDGLTDPYKASFGGKKAQSKGNSTVEHGQFRNDQENQTPQPVDIQTGGELSKSAAELVGVAAHIDMLAERFPRGSSQYKEAMTKTANDTFGKKFKAAWNIFFGKESAQ